MCCRSHNGLERFMITVPTQLHTLCPSKSSAGQQDANYANDAQQHMPDLFPSVHTLSVVWTHTRHCFLFLALSAHSVCFSCVFLCAIPVCDWVRKP